MAGAQLDGVATICDQTAQQAGFLGVRVQRLEQLQMLGQNLQNLIGIQRVAFGTTEFESLPELGHRGGMDRVEYKEIISQQSVNQRSARLLDGDGDGPASKALPQLG